MKNKYLKIKNDYRCPFIMTNDLIGGKWKLRIIWHIINGHNRFSMLQKCICDITPKVLMSQLKELEASGLINRSVLKAKPPKVVVYEVNPEHGELVKLVSSICDFAHSYSRKSGITMCGDGLQPGEQSQHCENK